MSHNLISSWLRHKQLTIAISSHHIAEFIYVNQVIFIGYLIISRNNGNLNNPSISNCTFHLFTWFRPNLHSYLTIEFVHVPSFNLLLTNREIAYGSIICLQTISKVAYKERLSGEALC